MLALAASGGAAAGSIIIKRMGRPASVLTVSAWQLIVGSAPLLILSAVLERSASVVWNGELISLILVLALLGTGTLPAAPPLSATSVAPPAAVPH